MLLVKLATVKEVLEEKLMNTPNSLLNKLKLYLFNIKTVYSNATVLFYLCEEKLDEKELEKLYEKVR